MKNISLGQTLTVLANVGVIIGIGVLVYELQQSRAIALSQMYQTAIGTRIELSNSIASNAEVWSRGNTGEPLTPAEHAIFSQQVRNLEDDTYFRIQVDRLMGIEGADVVDMAEFALYLHRNPGAYAVWKSRQEDLQTYRGVVDPGNTFADTPLWPLEIESQISKFEGFDDDGAN